MFRILLFISSLSLGGSSDRVSHYNEQAAAIYQTQPDSAIYFANMSLALNDGKDLKEMGLSYSIKGTVYSQQMMFDSSLTNHLASLDCRKKLDDPGLIGRSLINIGNVYYWINDLNNAEKYYNWGLQYHLKSGNQLSMAYAHNCLGSVNIERNDLGAAKAHFFDGLEYVEEMDQESIKYNLYINLGVLYEQEGQLDSALIMFRKAEKWYSEVGLDSDLVTLYIDIGVIYKNQGRYDSSKYYFEQAMLLGEQSGSWKDAQLASSDWLYNKFEQENDTASLKVLRSYVESNRIVDSLLLNKNIQEVEAEYQVEKNTLARQIAEDQARFQKTKREIEQKEANRNILILSLSGAFVFLLAIWVVVYYRQKNRISNYQLQEKKDEVNRVVAQQETKIYKAQLTGESSERKRVAQELHDRVGGLLATVNLHLENIVEPGEEPDESVVHMQKLVHESIKEVRSISHNLAMDIHVLGLKSTIEQFAEGINNTGKLKVNTYYELNSITPSIEISRECLKIIRELVANTLKYAEAKEINIQLSEIEDTMQMIYEDDGKGFEFSQVTKGLGLEGMKNRTTKLGGTIEFDSTLGRGTTVVITIPI